ncbi:MAG: calcium-translocating P-type ATPase, PMCA-type [Clostridia bacterium]|nr:calcium-translocating P-type ATPase, PMCA-type [Clostridia bacterium]
MSKPTQDFVLFHTISPQEAVEQLRTDDKNGLRTAEAEARLRRCGENALKKGKKKGFLQRFMLQFGDFMVLILLAAAAVSFAVSCLQGEADFADPLLILGIVIANALIGTVQEARAERALEALQNLSAPKAEVLRDGKRQIVPGAELVPGDLVRIKAGDVVPADIRLLESTQLGAEESALTGESVPAEKDATWTGGEKTPAAERKNMLFSGTGIAVGHGIGVVTATGMNTEMGRIAAMLGEEDAPETPLKARLHKTGKVIGLVVVGICAVLFVIGLFQKTPPLEMFMIAISLAVAAIPEGLPAVVTIVLALGVRRMAAKRAVIRHLQAVETLGSCQVICSDKTGTLTQNKMTVVRCTDGEGVLSETDRIPLLEAAALCTNVEIEGQRLIGAPTETALAAALPNPAAILYKRQKAAEIPFSSERKRMTVVLHTENGYRVITKGAPDLLLQRCTAVQLRGKTVPMTAELRQRILLQNAEMAGEALRVLGAAEKTLSALPQSDEAAESGLCFLGLIGLEDPPRPEVKQAVQECLAAGIRPVMITGDQPSTAAAIAERLDMDCTKAMTGAQLDGLSEEKLLEAVKTCSVYARVSPAHKMRIVKAFRRLHLVTAMTGDGVNDAPALKAADIGCAMGKNGTEVAKNAADMVLTDDNFATIVSAVREGRTVYRNIRKTIHFLMSCNIGEILVVLTAFLLRAPSPLLPAQLLWVNLVTDALPALALGSDPPEADVMREPPTPQTKTVFSGGLGFTMLVEGVMIGVLSLLAFSIGRFCFDADPAVPVTGRTMAFAVLSLSQLVHSFNVRSEKPLVGSGLLKNRLLNLAFLVCAGLMAAVILFPPAAALFGAVSLTATQWMITALLSVLPLLLCEAEKRLLAEKKPKGRNKSGE